MFVYIIAIWGRAGDREVFARAYSGREGDRDETDAGRWTACPEPRDVGRGGQLDFNISGFGRSNEAAVDSRSNFRTVRADGSLGTDIVLVVRDFEE